MGRLLDHLQAIVRREANEVDASLGSLQRTQNLITAARRVRAHETWDELVNQLDRTHLGDH